MRKMCIILMTNPNFLIYTTTYDRVPGGGRKWKREIEIMIDLWENNNGIV